MSYVLFDNKGRILSASSVGLDGVTNEFAFPEAVYDARPVVRGWDGMLYFEGEVPKKPLEEVRTSALSRIDSATSAAILAGFDYEVEGEKLHFSYDSFDQQNFADTANACLLTQSGVEGLPTYITWNAYRNWTQADGGDLVRLALDVAAFLTLYTAGALVHKATQMEIGGQRKAAVEACETVEEINALLVEWFEENN